MDKDLVNLNVWFSKTWKDTFFHCNSLMERDSPRNDENKRYSTDRGFSIVIMPQACSCSLRVNRIMRSCPTTSEEVGERHNRVSTIYVPQNPSSTARLCRIIYIYIDMDIRLPVGDNSANQNLHAFSHLSHMLCFSKTLVTNIHNLIEIVKR